VATATCGANCIAGAAVVTRMHLQLCAVCQQRGGGRTGHFSTSRGAALHLPAEVGEYGAQVSWWRQGCPGRPGRRSSWAHKVFRWRSTRLTRSGHAFSFMRSMSSFNPAQLHPRPGTQRLVRRGISSRCQAHPWRRLYSASSL
jgi:hypothetical protein